jgi:CheY-like chemotaxis protein
MAHVFVVDDDPGIRAVLRSALEAEDHAVLEAADGVSALERLRASPWSLVVLLDLRMPYLDGAGVLGTVAGDRVLALRHRFLLLTSTPLPLPPALGTLLACLNVPVVSKPFDVDSLLDVVAHLAHDTHGARGARTAPSAARPGGSGHAPGGAGGRAAAPTRLPPGSTPFEAGTHPSRGRRAGDTADSARHPSIGARPARAAAPHG